VDLLEMLNIVPVVVRIKVLKMVGVNMGIVRVDRVAERVVVAIMLVMMVITCSCNGHGVDGV
jgi:hypothetical protein